jgi:hypothetical protein
MASEWVSKEELEKERTPSELWGWLIQKVNQICSTEEGTRAFRLQNDNGKLIKKLVEEIIPLSIFGTHKFGHTDHVFLKPVIGSQPDYDAIVIDSRIAPVSKTFLEITQAHEGEGDYWRRCELLEKGSVPSRAPVIKTGEGKKHRVSIPYEATSVEEDLKDELNRIVMATKRKADKDKPAHPSLIVFFDDTILTEERLQILCHEDIDSFVQQRILSLDLRFSKLYLVGEARDIFREYPIADRG